MPKLNQKKTGGSSRIMRQSTSIQPTTAGQKRGNRGQTKSAAPKRGGPARQWTESMPRALTTDDVSTIASAVIRALPGRSSSTPDTPRTNDPELPVDAKDMPPVRQSNGSQGDTPEQDNTSSLNPVGSNPEDFGK